MTKEFQKELLEKVKPGMKPSDIKKLSQKPSKVSKSPPPMSISKSDEGYSSEEEKSFADNYTSSLSEVYKNNFAEPETADFKNQITSLKKQLQLYKDFRESDLKIKEDLKESINKLQTENKSLKENISRLEKPAKSPQEPQLTEKKKEPKLYLFTCSICDQNKKSQLHLAKVNGLGIDPTKLQKICDYCIKRVDLIQEREEDFF